MSHFLNLVAVVAAVLFSYVMLVKVGMPWFLAALIAPVAGYLVWGWENEEAEDEPKWASWLRSVKDLKDISKYMNQIF